MEKISKKTLVLLSSVAFLLFSCAPVVEILNFDVKAPAVYPVNFDDKSVSVFVSVFPDDSLDQAGTDYRESMGIMFLNDTSHMLNLALGIASTIEDKLYLDQEGVYIFKHFPQKETEYDLSYIFTLSLNSNSDIIIVVDTVEIGNVDILRDIARSYQGSYATSYIFAPFRSVVKVFDAITGQNLARINQTDTIYWEVLTRNDLRPEALRSRAEQSLGDVSAAIGKEVISLLFPRWVPQERSLYYYPTHGWTMALDNAIEFRWKEAMDFWMVQTEKKDAVKAAAAAYNLAVACELTDRLELAIQWVDISLRKYALPGVKEYKNSLTGKLEKVDR